MQASSPAQFSTRFSNGNQGLFHAMDAAEQFCIQQGAPIQASNTVRLCIEELVTNAFKYGAGNDPVSVSIFLTCENGHVLLEIADDAKPFNPLTEAPAPDLTEKLEDRAVGGLGIYLIRQMTKKMDYRYQDKKNILTINI